MLPRHALRSAGAGGSLQPGLYSLGRALGLRGMASGVPTTATPPPDLSRAGTADLCDVHVPEPVDVVAHQRVDIMEPIFRQGCPNAARRETLVAYTDFRKQSLSGSAVFSQHLVY